MRKPVIALFTGLTLVVLLGASDVTGNWSLNASFDDSSIEGGEIDCALKQDGEQLKGNCSGGTAELTGEVKGHSISWRLGAGGAPADTNITFTGTVDDAGTTMKGRFTKAGKGGSFTASKSR